MDGSEGGPPANQELACFRWHGTASPSQRSSFFAGKVPGACCADRCDHLPPPGRADIEKPCFCYCLAQIVMIGSRLLHEAQGGRTAAEHQREADLLLSQAMDFQQACQPHPDLIERQARNRGLPAPKHTIKRTEEPEDPCMFGKDQLADLADASVRDSRAGLDRRGCGAVGSD
jgi:hypothetical protein